jgi:formiminoglutamase
MNFSFLSPVSDDVVVFRQLLSPQTIGKKLQIHTEDNGIPDLNGGEIALLGVLENRRNEFRKTTQLNFDEIRKSIYSLFPGSWNANVVDLGDLKPGETVEDTYFALKETLSILISLNVIPVILGGSQDLTYANYRAYDAILPMVNIVNVDSRFDLGEVSETITSKSFVGKIILEEPYNLFNYATLGYQTYFNSQEEIDLMKKLYFEAYRLGEVSKDITLVEPVLRDANIVSVDISSVESSILSENQKMTPNGFSGKEICAIARYAGISNKVSSFGIFDLNTSQDENQTAMLVAQMVWYFMEGVNGRIIESDFIDDKTYQKYITLVDDFELIFYKSLKSGRWWIEIPFLSNVNNKLKKHTLLPCAKSDYDMAINNIVPERWYKAHQKNIL